MTDVALSVGDHQHSGVENSCLLVRLIRVPPGVPQLILNVSTAWSVVSSTDTMWTLGLRLAFREPRRHAAATNSTQSDVMVIRANLAVLFRRYQLSSICLSSPKKAE